MLLKKREDKAPASEKNMGMIQFGRMAEAVWPEFAPVIKLRREQALNTLKQLYGDKKTDCSLYIAEVAIISCLDEIISTVDRSIRLSHHKEKELINGNTNPGQ